MQETELTTQKLHHNGTNDFDFAIGQWNVKHKRLRNISDHQSPWIEFEGQSSTAKTLGGLGNVEQNILHFPQQSFHAMAIRSYDPVT